MIGFAQWKPINIRQALMKNVPIKQMCCFYGALYREHQVTNKRVSNSKFSRIFQAAEI